MGISTGLAVPLFLFVASITCDKSLGQNALWNGPQTYAVNGGMGFSDGAMYSGGGGDTSRKYGGSSTGAAAFGGGNRGMAFGRNSASVGGGGFYRGAADAGANSGAGAFSTATVGNGARTFDGGATGNGFGGFGSGAIGNGAGGFQVASAGNGIQGFDVASVGNYTPGFGAIAADNGGFVVGQGNALPATAASARGPAGYDGFSNRVGNGFGGLGAGSGGFSSGAVGNGAGGFEVVGAANGVQGFDVAPVGNFTPGFGGIAADNGVGGFVARQGNAPPPAAANTRRPAGYDEGAGGALPPGAVRNGAWKSGRGRLRKIKSTFLSGGFSVKKSLAYVKNAFTSSYFKLSLPDSQKRVAKCSGLVKSAGFSLGSMYQAYFALYNDISASHGEMSLLEVGALAFMETALSIVNFLKSTPLACLMNVVGSFDYLSLIYSLLGLVGCDSLCVAKWTTYMSSMFV